MAASRQGFGVSATPTSVNVPPPLPPRYSPPRSRTNPISTLSPPLPTRAQQHSSKRAPMGKFHHTHSPCDNTRRTHTRTCTHTRFGARERVDAKNARPSYIFPLPRSVHFTSFHMIFPVFPGRERTSRRQIHGRRRPPTCLYTIAARIRKKNRKSLSVLYMPYTYVYCIQRACSGIRVWAFPCVVIILRVYIYNVYVQLSFSPVYCVRHVHYMNYSWQWWWWEGIFWGFVFYFCIFFFGK